MELVSWQIGHAVGPAARAHRAAASTFPRSPRSSSGCARARIRSRPSDEPELPRHAHAGARALDQRDGSRAADRLRRAHRRARRAPAARASTGLVDNLEARRCPRSSPLGRIGRERPAGRGTHRADWCSWPVSRPAADDRRADRATPARGLADRRSISGPPIVDGRASRPAPAARRPRRSARLVRSCVVVAAAGRAAHGRARRRSARVLVLPTLLTRARAATLRDATACRSIRGAVRDRVARSAAAVRRRADYARRGRRRHRAVPRPSSRDRVEIVGDAGAVAGRAARARARDGRARRAISTPRSIAGWAVHVWTPRADRRRDRSTTRACSRKRAAPACRASCPRPRAAASTASSRRTCSSTTRRRLASLVRRAAPRARRPDGAERARRSEARAPGRRARRRSPPSKAVVQPAHGLGALPIRAGRTTVPHRGDSGDGHRAGVRRARRTPRAASRASCGTRAVDVPIELLVIDDASPELPIREYVDEFATRPAPFPITVLHNPENLGFVRTVNRGLRQRRGRRRDPELRHRGHRRLARPARGRGRAPDVATVTPLTSHGSICTLPDVDHRGVRARRRRPADRRVRGVRARALARAARPR